jgi:hypothetical protein
MVLCARARFARGGTNTPDTLSLLAAHSGSFGVHVRQQLSRCFVTGEFERIVSDSVECALAPHLIAIFWAVVKTNSDTSRT